MMKNNNLVAALQQPNVTFEKLIPIIADLSDDEIFKSFNKISSDTSSTSRDKGDPFSYLDTPSADDLLYRDIGNIVPINKAQEKCALAMIYANRDKTGFYRDKVVEHNVRYIVHIAKRYSESSGFTPAELLTAGYEGMNKAIKSFDPNMEIAFLTYAHHFIVFSISNEIFQLKNLLHVPTKYRKLIGPVIEYIDENNASFSNAAKRFNVHIDVVKAIYSFFSIGSMVSMNLLKSEDHTTEIGDYIPSGSSYDPYHKLTIEFIASVLEEAKAKVLNDSEATILRMYIYDECSFAAIGEVLHKSAEWIRQIYIKALEKIRDYLHSKGIYGVSDLIDDYSEELDAAL